MAFYEGMGTDGRKVMNSPGYNVSMIFEGF